ncbi:MAG: hypothetical protein IKJ88_09750, partial [Clostridia bacterium]|nr:hypothetical protein [Clostridia bacterium]
MKKTLFALFVCLILIAGTVLVASAADVNTEPLVVDLSSATGTKQCALNPEANNRINYVVTGSNPDAEIFVWGSCNITLRNASFRRLHIDYEDSYTVNITLEGENTIDQYNWASQGALEIYRSDVTINGGENDSLYAKSRTFSAYGQNWNEGSLTVNGGNITFESTDASGGSPLQVKYIQNGGTVKAISAADYSFLYDLELNAGSLEIQHNASSRGAFAGNVKIKEGASMKLSSPSKAFAFYETIGLAEDAAISDHLVVRFDENSDFVALDKLNTILNGKTYAQIKVESHTGNYENGVCGDCGTVCTHDTDNGTCGVCSKYIYKFTHQPTDKEPYVTLNNSTDAVYQWYKMSDTAEITDSDEIYLWSDFFGEESEESSYDSKFGWSPIILYDSGDYVDYIIADFKAGDTVILEFTSPVYLAYMSNIAEEAEVEFTIDGNIATGIVETDGAYVVWAEAEGTKPSVKIYRGAIAINALSGETSATLANPAYGAYYYCEATAGDGTVLVSSIADFSYRITHHPTPARMYVTLSNDTGAAYQWYKGERVVAEVTDSSVTYPWSDFDAPFEGESIYSAENGWSAIVYREDGDEENYLYYILTDFKSSDELTLEFSSPVYYVSVFDLINGSWIECTIEGTIATCVIETDGVYGIEAITENTAPSLKIYKNDVQYTAVSGATAATFTPGELGRYCCEVTFQNGEKKRSKTVDIGCFHNFETQVIAPTCTEDGYTAYTCSICGDVYTDNTVDAVGHTQAIDEAVPPTCTVTGLTEGKHCSVCGEVIAAQTEVAALGHNEVPHAAQSPTCTEIGWGAYVTCSRCNYTTYEEIEATGHSWIEATCENAEYCSLCGTVGDEALGHDSVWHEGQDADCTQWGWYEYETCTRCDFTTYCEIPPYGHNWHAASCSNPKTCLRCRETEGEALGHDFEWCEALAPTCTEFGWKEYQACKRCTYTTKELVPSLGYDSHDIISHEALSPTCTEIGWDAYESCSRCPYTTYAEIEATGHSWSDGDCTALQTCSVCSAQGTEYAHTWVEATCTQAKHCSVCSETVGEALGHDEINHEAFAPTCTQNGWEAYVTCSRCDYTTKEEIESLGHDISYHEAYPPTCTQLGWEAYEACSRCFYTTFERLDALGHSWTDTSCIATKVCSVCGVTEGEGLGHSWIPATCTTPKTCFVCSETEGNPLGHDEVNHGAKTPTCTEIGWDAYVTCTRCDYTTYEEAEALGHDEVPHTAKAPACAAVGWEAYVTCTRCDYTTYEELSATGHSWNDATCTAPKTCKICGATSGSKLSHKSDNGTVTKNASCTQTGTKIYNCTLCSAVVKTETIEKLAHSYDSGKITTKATCKTAGVRTYTCTLCGATKTESIAKLTNHSYATVTTPATLTADGSIVKECNVCGNVASNTAINKIATVTLSATSYTYKASVITPDVTVKDSAGNVLTRDTDYTVSYASGRRNVGTY